MNIRLGPLSARIGSDHATLQRQRVKGVFPLDQDGQVRVEPARVGMLIGERRFFGYVLGREHALPDSDAEAHHILLFCGEEETCEPFHDAPDTIGPREVAESHAARVVAIGSAREGVRFQR